MIDLPLLAGVDAAVEADDEADDDADDDDDDEDPHPAAIALTPKAAQATTKALRLAESILHSTLS